MKAWIKKQWLRFKAWALALLIAVGLVAAPLALSAPKDFYWTNATQRVDGSPFPASELAETRIYCNGSLVGSALGSATQVTIDLSVGAHTCYATHVDTDGQESDPSGEVSFVITPARPNPPVLSVN